MTDSDRREYLPRPIIGVGAVVWHGERVLLIRRAKEPNRGRWSLPGGAQELGETLHDAVRREVLEETGIRISEPVLLDTVDLITPDQSGNVRFHYTLIDFMADAMDADPVPGGDVDAAIWAGIDELPQYRLWQKTIDMIALAQKRRRD